MGFDVNRQKYATVGGGARSLNQGPVTVQALQFQQPGKLNVRMHIRRGMN